ncbi:hypothetical protein HJFPF1_13069 [Paramyrothecium foliicola]|nr:hypothetical protein HJFPF1_13069 [Paramyrothecium foliicola]
MACQYPTGGVYRFRDANTWAAHKVRKARGIPTPETTDKPRSPSGETFASAMRLVPAVVSSPSPVWRQPADLAATDPANGVLVGPSFVRKL